MKKNNIPNTKEIFAQEEKAKFLRDSIFQPDKL